MGKQKIPPVCSEQDNNGHMGALATADREYLTQKGAMALARRLEGYWHARKFPAARFWAEPIGERFEKVGTYEIYRVVSNLINGLPPRYAKQGFTDGEVPG